jgi:hypothetical protein
MLASLSFYVSQKKTCSILASLDYLCVPKKNVFYAGFTIFLYVSQKKYVIYVGFTIVIYVSPKKTCSMLASLSFYVSQKKHNH